MPRSMSDMPRDRRPAGRRLSSLTAGGHDILELHPPAWHEPIERVAVDEASAAAAGWPDAWYRELFDGLPTATIVTTLDGVVMHANTAACLLFRRPPTGVAGHPLAAFVPTAHRAAFSTLLERARREAHVADFALSIVPSDAAGVDCRVWVRRIVMFGDPSAILAWTLASLVPEF
jgi:PAS domain S-box-containing protein